MGLSNRAAGPSQGATCSWGAANGVSVGLFESRRRAVPRRELLPRSGRRGAPRVYIMTGFWPSAAWIRRRRASSKSSRRSRRSRPRRTRQWTQRSRGSSRTCEAAATTPCSNTRSAFDAVARRVGGGARNRRRRNAPRLRDAAGDDARGVADGRRADPRLSRTAGACVLVLPGRGRQRIRPASHCRSTGSASTCPGGRAAYPSSVLMTVIPAHVAGVAEIVMVVPTPGGARNPLVLAAAHLAGVTRAFAIGGAQAIAALAYGTATVPRSTRSADPATPMSPRPSGACSARSAST